jgi:hypothetical protein
MKAYKETELLGFVLKRRQPNYDFVEPKLAGMHLNLNYILTFKVTLRSWEEKEQCAVNRGVAKTGVQ